MHCGYVPFPFIFAICHFHSLPPFAISIYFRYVSLPWRAIRSFSFEGLGRKRDLHYRLLTSFPAGRFPFLRPVTMATKSPVTNVFSRCIESFQPADIAGWPLRSKGIRKCARACAGYSVHVCVFVGIANVNKHMPVYGVSAGMHKWHSLAYRLCFVCIIHTAYSHTY